MPRISLDITNLAILDRYIDAATTGTHVTGCRFDFAFQRLGHFHRSRSDANAEVIASVGLLLVIIKTK
jgi:hypothetical protein